MLPRFTVLNIKFLIYYMLLDIFYNFKDSLEQQLVIRCTKFGICSIRKTKSLIRIHTDENASIRQQYIVGKHFYEQSRLPTRTEDFSYICKISLQESSTNACILCNSLIEIGISLNQLQHISMSKYLYLLWVDQVIVHNPKAAILV